MINFYRWFIPGEAAIGAPLNYLHKKGVKFEQGEKEQKAFEILKEVIISPLVLRMPDFTLPFVVQTDAISVALGVVLSQVVDEERQPVAFTSRTLTPQEMKCTVYELECLAVVFALDKFRRFLEH